MLLEILYTLGYLFGEKEGGNERELARKANHIVVTSNYLKDKMKKFNKNLVLIRNACDYEHFAKANVRKNKLVSTLKSPVICYYGALAEWFDIEMVDKAIRANPKWNFVFIGAISDNSLLKLKKHPRAYFYGEKPYASLPSFLSGVDVCMIPFKLTPLINATDPVKFYEMLAAGKPVVASKIPEISHNKEPMLYIVNKKNNLSSQIKKALKQDSVEVKRKRRVIAKNNTWEKRATEYEKIFSKTYPKVSIIIVTYNNWKLTNNCLNSLDLDGYPNKEIIVVDNLSSDQTRAELKKLHKRGNIQAVLNNQNYGFAKGNNIGINKATGKYISLLNNDVEVSPLWIQKMIKHLNDDSSIGLLGPVTNQSGNETKIPIKGSKQRVLKMGRLYANNHTDQLFDITALPAQCWFMRMKDMEKVGKLDQRFGVGMFEDDDYCYRVREHGKRVVCTEDVFVYHRGKAAFDLMGDEAYRKLFNENKEKYERKWKVKWTPHEHRKMKTL